VRKLSKIWKEKIEQVCVVDAVVVVDAAIVVVLIGVVQKIISLFSFN
jgi:hypothetical protein